jgi:hypothetical protein
MKEPLGSSVNPFFRIRFSSPVCYLREVLLNSDLSTLPPRLFDYASQFLIKYNFQ